MALARCHVMQVLERPLGRKGFLLPKACPYMLREAKAESGRWPLPMPCAHQLSGPLLPSLYFLLTHKTLNSAVQTGNLQVTQDLSSVLFDTGVGTLPVNTVSCVSEMRLLVSFLPSLLSQATVIFPL